MRGDPNALEVVLQTGGETFGESVFDARSFSFDIAWPNNRPLETAPQLNGEELARLSDLLLKAAKRTLEPFTDKRVGFLLSGGVDSSVCLYLIKQAFPSCDVKAYHTDWGIPERSEIRYAETAAKLANVPLRVVDTSAEAQIPHIDDALSGIKTISYSAVPVYMAFRAMVEDGMDVGVNALGLDELMAGYPIHQLFYARSSLNVVPYFRRLERMRYYRAASLRWGTDKAWLLRIVAPRSSTRYVTQSTVDLGTVYEEKVKAYSLWNTIHNWLLNAMIHNFAPLMSRAAAANGLKLLFPYIDHQLMDRCLSYSPKAKVNKAPIRALMRTRFGFPEELASRGEKWGSKIGWGGTHLPYVQSRKYLDAVMPKSQSAEEWFVSPPKDLYSEIHDRQNPVAFDMALFLKILELTT